MLARSVLIRLSRSEWLADQFRRRSFARRAVRRFMPGEELEDALVAGEVAIAEGIPPVFTQLGEQISTEAEAEEVCAHYVEVLDRLRERGIAGQVSVKPTQLGLLQDASACADRVDSLARRAAAAGTRLWIDMEESEYVDRTLDLYAAVRRRHENVGVCLQAYLYRTEADVERLLPLRPSIRLVKGAYREPPEIAYPQKARVDEKYFELGRRLLEAAADGRALPVFGTHDTAMIARLRSHAATVGAADGAFEVHMLYGIGVRDQLALSKSGVQVRVLISYGRHWFPWYMRRLAERPANVWFVVRSVFA